MGSIPGRCKVILQRIPSGGRVYSANNAQYTFAILIAYSAYIPYEKLRAQDK